MFRQVVNLLTADRRQLNTIIKHIVQCHVFELKKTTFSGAGNVFESALSVGIPKVKPLSALLTWVFGGFISG